MTEPRDPLLQEREKTHGSFETNALTWSRLCKSSDYNRLNERQKLALTIIFMKIARLEQQPNIKDHWDDIAGYAKLGSEACE